ncbi:hypothetical protein PVAG01_11160 [Phlyctema vagabunda]|uniref:Uncharacterized protein n=1 Tax=Phlyctema vagabunda TaxID=108571 RepID=A0ABR4P1I1_9HELO
MPSAFHTFKLIPGMASTNNRQTGPILSPSTPSNNSNASSSNNGNAQPATNENATGPAASSTPMQPPSLPRSLMTPARDVREGSVASSVGSSSRKPRQNLSETDHILMMKACYDQRGKFKEGTKADFWNGVNQAFAESSGGKVLAQMSATVGRLVEGRRRQISDWENRIIAQKPGGELNELLDSWIEFLRVEDGDAEAERVRQVEARRRLEEQRKEARRQADAAQALMSAQNPGVSIAPAPPQQLQPHPHAVQQPHQQGNDDVYITNGHDHHAVNGLERPRKRQRTERQLTRELTELQAQVQQEAREYQALQMQEPVKRVVVEGQLTKEDWRDIMGNDSRLRALENKVDKIELIVSQNNKLLLQLMSNQGKERQEEDDGRVPVHLDAEFDRDYL